MTTAAQPPSIGIVGQAVTTRIASIDIFRGLTMVVMIFVNDLASVRGLPWWNYHALAKIDAMTYVDMVFPFFLFIVGVSIPLAVKQRLKKSGSISALWVHVFLRAGSLVVLGLILTNAEKGDAARMGISDSGWALIALTGAALFLNVYSGSKRYATLFRVLRFTGLLTVVAMLAIFRRITSDGQVGWIDGSYPEILGLIGYTYLAVCILYIPTRRWLWAPLVWFVALVALCAFSTAKWIGFTHHVPLYFWPFGNGALACITMAGVVTSSIFLDNPRWEALRQKILLALTLAFSTLVAGWMLTSLGISKIRATPTWCLYCIGASILLFTALWWVCDVRKQTAWAFFARPAGANTLTTYLLPDFYYFILSLTGISYFATHYNSGWTGAVRSGVFTALILAVAAILTKWRVRLQL